MFWYHHVMSTAGNPLAVHSRFTEYVSLTDMAVGPRGDKISAGAAEQQPRWILTKLGDFLNPHS